MKNSRTGYMCAVDFYHEIGAAMGGNRVYSSIKDLRENLSCVDQCGIVKVTISLSETIQDSNYEDLKAIDKNYEKSQEYFEHLKDRVHHFSKITDNYKALQEKFNTETNNYRYYDTLNCKILTKEEVEKILKSKIEYSIEKQENINGTFRPVYRWSTF